MKKCLWKIAGLMEDLFLGSQWSIILGYRRLSVKFLLINFLSINSLEIFPSVGFFSRTDYKEEKEKKLQVKNNSMMDKITRENAINREVGRQEPVSCEPFHRECFYVTGTHFFLSNFSLSFLFFHGIIIFLMNFF